MRYNDICQLLDECLELLKKQLESSQKKVLSDKGLSGSLLFEIKRPNFAKFSS